ncbi:unnamed protein product [Ectocarpus sp. 8 AP-2014]
MSWWCGSTMPPRTSCRATPGWTTGGSSSRWTTTPALTGSRTPATSPSAECRRHSRTPCVCSIG